MAIRKERIFVDARGKRVIASYTEDTTVGLNPFVQGDTLEVELYFLEPDGNGGFAPIVPTWDQVAVGLFRTTDVPPSDGTFTATFGADTTAGLDHDISSAALQTALNALASISAAGGVTVSAAWTGSYLIKFNVAGVRDLLVCNGAQLLPSGFCSVKHAVTQGAGVKDVQLVSVFRNPIASQFEWEALPGPSAVVTSLADGGDGENEIQRITFPGFVIGGLFRIKYGDSATIGLPWNALASDVQAALEALEDIGAGNVSVGGSVAGGLTITFQGELSEEDVPELEVQASGLQVLPGLRGTFALTDYAVEELLAGGEEAEAVFELELSEDGAKDTLLDLDAVVLNGRFEPETQTTQGTSPLITQALADGRYLRITNKLSELGWTVDEGGNLVFAGKVSIGPGGFKLWNADEEAFVAIRSIGTSDGRQLEY